MQYRLKFLLFAEDGELYFRIYDQHRNFRSPSTPHHLRSFKASNGIDVRTAVCPAVYSAANMLFLQGAGPSKKHAHSPEHAQDKFVYSHKSGLYLRPPRTAERCVCDLQLALIEWSANAPVFSRLTPFTSMLNPVPKNLRRLVKEKRYAQSTLSEDTLAELEFNATYV